MLDDDLPKGRDDELADRIHDRDVDTPRPDHSLTDDISALIEDGKTYAEAELAFQKSRLAFAADRGKSGALLVLAALAFVHLGLVALVVGLVIALSPVVGAFGATAIVAGVLVVLAIIAALMAKARFGKAASAFEDDAS